MKNLFHSMENIKPSIFQWVSAFTGIVFVRFFLEAIFSPTPSGVVPSDAQTIVHYIIFYAVAIVGLMLLFHFFTGKGLSVATISLSIFMLLWLPPVIDFFASGGSGFVLAYPFLNLTQLCLTFITFLGTGWLYGTTPGLHIELALVLGLSCWYVFQSTGSKLKTVLFGLTLYTFIFFTGAVPSLLYVVSHWATAFSASSADIHQFLYQSMVSSALVHNTLHATLFVSPERFFELAFNKLISQMWFIFGIMASLVWFFRLYPEKIKAVLKNSRPSRVAHYLSMVIFGTIFAYAKGFGTLSSWIDVLSLVCLLISWYAAWMFCVHLNDLSDIDTDALSNPDRPLISGTLSVLEMKQSAFVWLIVALTGSFSVGYYQYYMCVASLALGYVYSDPLLRLKRVTILSSFIIGSISLASFLAGFFFISFDKSIQAFSPVAAMGIIIMFTLLTNIRDLKDVEGDAAAGIKTLPVIFGARSGRKVVASLFAASFLIVPLFTFFYPLFFVAVPTAAIAYYQVIKKVKEKYFFILYFVFVFASSLFYVFY